MTFKEIREANIARHWNSTTDICGGKARARELMCAREKSHKTKVAEQNEIDVYIKILRDGKPCYVPAECKTNGGRVDEMLNGTTKAKYVIYWLDFTQKLKNSVDVRVLPPVVIPTDLFMAMLDSLGIIKAINRHGVLDGYGIQVSSKKLYITLQNYIEDYAEAVLFDNEKTFEDWELEGLEMRYNEMIIRGEG
jgi:hypothetical protein